VISLASVAAGHRVPGGVARAWPTSAGRTRWSCRLHRGAVRSGMHPE